VYNTFSSRKEMLGMVMNTGGLWVALVAVWWRGKIDRGERL